MPVPMRGEADTGADAGADAGGKAGAVAGADASSFRRSCCPAA